jgi:hypothetical protein
VIPSVIALVLFCAQSERITRVTVNQVRIDAVVTDSKGNAVRGLSSEDFEVVQDAKRQKPIRVEYVAGPEAAPSPKRELQASGATIVTRESGTAHAAAASR